MSWVAVVRWQLSGVRVVVVKVAVVFEPCLIRRPLRNRPNKPLYDVTFAGRFLRGKQMTACKQIRVHAVVVTQVCAEFDVLQ